MASKTVITILKAKDQTSQVVKGIKSSFGSLTGAISLAQVGYLKLAQVVSQFGGKAIESFKIQEQAEAKLVQALKNQGTFTEANIKRLKDLAKARQKVTQFGDEETISAQAMLASFKLNTEQIADLTPLMQDLAVMTSKTTGSQADLEAMGKLVGLALEGQAGRLTQAGISMTKAQKEALALADRTEKAAIVMEIMRENAGGLAEAVGNTLSAQLKKTNNDIGDQFEALGEDLLPTYIAMKKTALVLMKALVFVWKGINTSFNIAVSGFLAGAGMINDGVVFLMEGFRKFRMLISDLGVDKIFNSMMETVLNTIAGFVNSIKTLLEKINVGGIFNKQIKMLDGAVKSTQSWGTAFKKAGEDIDETQKIADKGLKNMIEGQKKFGKGLKDTSKIFLKQAEDIAEGMDKNKIEFINNEKKKTQVKEKETEKQEATDKSYLNSFSEKINNAKRIYENNENLKTEINKHQGELRDEEISARTKRLREEATQRESDYRKHIEKMNEINAPFWGTFKTAMEGQAERYGNHTALMESLASGTASTMHSSFKNLFFDVMHGNMGDALKNFGENFIKGMETALLNFLSSLAVSKFLELLGFAGTPIKPTVVPVIPVGGGGQPPVPPIVPLGPAGGATTGVGIGAVIGSALPPVIAGALITGALGMAFKGGFLTPEEAQSKITELGDIRRNLESNLRVHPATGKLWYTERVLGVKMQELERAKKAYDDFVPVAGNFGANTSYSYGIGSEVLKLIRNELPSYLMGGVVQGLPSQSSLAVVHGKERITPFGSPEGKATSTVNISFGNVSVRRDTDIDTIIDKIKEVFARDDDLAGFGIA